MEFFQEDGDLSPEEHRIRDMGRRCHVMTMWLRMQIPAYIPYDTTGITGWLEVEINLLWKGYVAIIYLILYSQKVQK